MQSFDSHGVRIAYIDVPPEAGHGDPILLIHGFASNHAVNWVNTLWVTTLTRAGFRVVAFDNRGHGRARLHRRRTTTRRSWPAMRPGCSTISASDTRT